MYVEKQSRGHRPRREEIDGWTGRELRKLTGRGQSSQKRDGMEVEELLKEEWEESLAQDGDCSGWEGEVGCFLEACL